MTNPLPISDLEINAFADGELSGEAKDAVRRALEGDEAARAVAAWRDQLGDRLHAAYDPLLAEPLAQPTARLLQPGASPHRIWPAIALPRGSRRFAAAAAIAAVAAGVGYVAGLQHLAGDDAIGFVAQRALGAHQVFASEIRHPVEVAGSDSVHLAKWLGKRLGLEFSAPDISDAGFALVGGRLLAEGARPAAQLMYEDATGRRITLYMEKWTLDGETSLQLASDGGLSSYYWVNHPFACAVSGNIDSDKLKLVATRLYAQLEAK